jgi:hypothetical protein
LQRYGPKHVVYDGLDFELRAASAAVARRPETARQVDAAADRGGPHSRSTAAYAAVGHNVTGPSFYAQHQIESLDAWKRTVLGRARASNRRRLADACRALARPTSAAPSSSRGRTFEKAGRRVLSGGEKGAASRSRKLFLRPRELPDPRTSRTNHPRRRRSLRGPLEGRDPPTYAGTVLPRPRTGTAPSVTRESPRGVVDRSAPGTLSATSAGNYDATSDALKQEEIDRRTPQAGSSKRRRKRAGEPKASEKPIRLAPRAGKPDRSGPARTPARSISAADHAGHSQVLSRESPAAPPNATIRELAKLEGRHRRPRVEVPRSRRPRRQMPIRRLYRDVRPAFRELEGLSARRGSAGWSSTRL